MRQVNTKVVKLSLFEGWLYSQNRTTTYFSATMSFFRSSSVMSSRLAWVPQTRAVATRAARNQTFISVLCPCEVLSLVLCRLFDVSYVSTKSCRAIQLEMSESAYLPNEFQTGKNTSWTWMLGFDWLFSIVFMCKIVIIAHVWRKEWLFRIADHCLMANLEMETMQGFETECTKLRSLPVHFPTLRNYKNFLVISFSHQLQIYLRLDT